MNQLDSLRGFTTVVADTGDLAAIAKFSPQDATTNPSLILKSATDPRFATMVAEVCARHPRYKTQRIECIVEDLLVVFAKNILAMIPGRVSLEIAPELSFDSISSIRKAQDLVSQCDKAGINRDRLLIKLAATWEGIQAAKKLEREGIHCNLTLLFSFAQAQACADAGVTLISPFVGRIYDWYCAAEKTTDIPIERDPGVASVSRIFHYYKKYAYGTEIMGASFRKTEQILALAGCDLMTISPELLAELKAKEGEVALRLSKKDSQHLSQDEKMILSESQYRYEHNTSAMAVEKLSDGIRKFEADARKLAAFIAQQQ